MNPWFMRVLFCLLGALPLLSGCVRPPLRPPLPPPQPTPAPHPTFEHTGGEFLYGGAASLVFRYKSIVLLVDPSLETEWTASSGGGPARSFRRAHSPALTGSQLESADYVLLTDGESDHLGPTAEKALRPSQKILAPAAVARSLQARGFSQAKAIGTGQRLMLKKQNAFLFCTAVSGKTASGETANGYLLEFDNGTNLFVSGDSSDEASLREFVYGLKDDGREVAIAFLYDTPGAHDETALAKEAALLQPKHAVILQSRDVVGDVFDENQFRASLKEELFEGDTYRPSSGETLSF